MWVQGGGQGRQAEQARQAGWARQQGKMEQATEKGMTKDAEMLCKVPKH